MFADFRHLLGKLRRQPLSETGEGESIAAKRKVEYNKIRPNMRACRTTGVLWHTMLTIYFVVEKDHVAGLPRLAACQDSNLSFCIFRRFGPVAARILLVKEIESYRLRSTEFYEGCDPEQRKLMKEIEIKFKDYCWTEP